MSHAVRRSADAQIRMLPFPLPSSAYLSPSFVVEFVNFVIFPSAHDIVAN
jgi:hypothetical protein